MNAATFSGFLILLGIIDAPSAARRFNENISLCGKKLENLRKISRCTGEAAKALFTPSNDISVIVANRSYDSDLLQEILKESFAKRTVKVVTKIRIDPIVERTRLDVRESSFVVMENHGNYRRLMERPSVERSAEYIIVTESTTEWVSKFADQLWKLGFIKVAFVCVTTNGTSMIFRPIENSSIRPRGSSSLRAFDLCNENPTVINAAFPAKTKRVSSTIDPFSSPFSTTMNMSLKVAKIMEGTQSSYEFSRMKPDGKRTTMGLEILEILTANLHIEFAKAEWDNQDDSTWMDAVHRCVAGEFDFFYDRELPPEENCCQQVEPITWYSFHNLIFVDSLKSSIRPLASVFLPYHGIVWLCTFVLLGSFILFAYAIETLWGQRLIRERITMLHIWSIFVGQSLPVLPVKFSLRFVLTMWILYNLQSNQLYTGNFSSALTASDNTQILKTFQNILDSGRPICGSNRTKQLLNDTTDPVTAKISDRMEPASRTNIFDKILNENYIGSRHLFQVSAHNWLNRGNSSLRLYTIPQGSIVKYPLLYFAKKRHPYNNLFNKMIARIRDAGIVDYLHARYSDVLGKAREERPLAMSDGPFLKLEHLQVIFYILYVGHFISVIVFLIELGMAKRSDNRRNLQN